MLRSLLAIFGLFLVGLTLVGLTFSASARGRADFTLVNHSEPKNLDPGMMNGEPEGRVVESVFEGLTRLEAKSLEPVPGVAKSWEISADGKRYVFHLREDARWTDGRPVTAHDFAYAWRRLQEPKNGAEYAYILHMVRFAEAYNTYHAQAEALEGPIARALDELRREHPARVPAQSWRGFVAKHRLFAALKGTSDAWLAELIASQDPGLDADGMKRLAGALHAEAARRRALHAEAVRRFGVDAGVFAQDDRTLIVELVAPTPYFLELTAFYPSYPVPKWVVEKEGNADDWFLPEKIVSNGPFRLAEWRVGDRIRLEKSPTYWGRAEVALRSVDLLPTENVTTALNLYLSGEVDWLPNKSFPQDLAPLLKSRRDFYIGPALIVYFYRINVTRKPFDDIRVRKALNLAVDREQIAKDVLNLGELPATSFVPPGLPDYRPPAVSLGLDVARAKKLLAEAGFPDGKGFPPFGILYNTLEAHKKLAEVVADQLRRNLGLSVTAYNQEWQAYQSSTQTLNYDIARAGWVGDYEDPNTFLDLWLTNGGNNQTGWSEPTYDALMRAAANVEAFLEAPDALLGKLENPSEARALVANVRAAQGAEARLREAARLRLELLREAETLLLDRGLPIIPLYFYVIAGMVKPKVAGFYSELVTSDGRTRPNPRDIHPLREIRIRDAEAQP